MKILLIFTLCLISDGGVSEEVTGYSEKGVLIKCKYDAECTENLKYFCKGSPPVCADQIKTGDKNMWISSGRFSVFDDTKSAEFRVMISELTVQDTGTYHCGVDIDKDCGRDISTPVTLTVKEESPSRTVFTVSVTLLLLMGIIILSVTLHKRSGRRLRGKYAFRQKSKEANGKENDQNVLQMTNQPDSVHQSLNPITNQSDSVYQGLNPNTNQSDSVYHRLNPNTNQPDSVYQGLNPNTNQSDSVYHRLNPNTSQPDSVYQRLNPNTNQTDSVYQRLNPKTNQSDSFYQRLNPNTNQPDSVYQGLNPNTNQSDSVYHKLNPNTNQPDSVYQRLNPNTNQPHSVYQSLNPNTNQSDSVYQRLNPNTNQSDSVYQSLYP